jgi:hypothetical protein
MMDHRPRNPTQITIRNPGQLAEYPTLAQGHCADLRIDTGTTRVWVSRMGIQDGETRPLQVEVYKPDAGRWVEVCPHGYSFQYDHPVYGTLTMRIEGPGRVSAAGTLDPCYTSSPFHSGETP